VAGGQPEGFSLFALAWAILIIVCADGLWLNPVGHSHRLKSAGDWPIPRAILKRLWHAAPVAAADIVLFRPGEGGLLGVGCGVRRAAWVWIPGRLAGFVSLVIVAGALLQWPMGMILSVPGRPASWRWPSIAAVAAGAVC